MPADGARLAGRGRDLQNYYRRTPEALGRESSLLGVIFRKAQNKIANPANLERVIKMIEDEHRSAMDIDIKGEIYEGLLERNAQDVKGGAGQYFTPRPLIRAIVDVMNPQRRFSLRRPRPHSRQSQARSRPVQESSHPGTLRRRHCRQRLPALRHEPLPRRHRLERRSTTSARDALASPSSDHYDIVLTNPPFGKKGGFVIIGEDGRATTEKHSYERDDFWATTSNKQLNFLQHIVSTLKIQTSLSCPFKGAMQSQV